MHSNKLSPAIKGLSGGRPSRNKHHHRHNIEDLHTRDGRLRYQVTFVRPTLRQRDIREKIADYFAENEAAAQAMSDAVFGGRERAQRVSLRRLRL